MNDSLNADLKNQILAFGAKDQSQNAEQSQVFFL